MGSAACRPVANLPHGRVQLGLPHAEPHATRDHPPQNQKSHTFQYVSCLLEVPARAIKHGQ